MALFVSLEGRDIAWYLHARPRDQRPSTFVREGILLSQPGTYPLSAYQSIQIIRNMIGKTRNPRMRLPLVFLCTF
jgi:hypothetical protein